MRIGWLTSGVVLVALGLFLWATAPGMGTTLDSAHYVEIARNVLAGRGLTLLGEPLTHFPPVYPLLLAAAGMSGADPLTGIRWLHALFFVVNTLLVTALAYRMADRSQVAAAIAGALFLLSPEVLRIHTMVWSEAPFLTLLLLTLYFLWNHFASPPSTSRPLIVAAGAAGLAVLIRYLGVAFLPAVALGILMVGGQRPLSRIRDACLFLGVACIPTLLLLARNRSLSEFATNRQMAVHPIVSGDVRAAMQAFHELWLHRPCQTCSLAGLASLIGGCVLVAAALVISRQERHSTVDGRAIAAMQIVMATAAAAYLLSLFASMSFFDASTMPDTRLMSPVFVLTLLLAISVSWSAADIWPPFKPMLWTVLLAIAALNAPAAASMASALHANGHGFTSRAWQASAAIEYIRGLPADVAVHSNGAEIIQLLTGRRAMPLPVRINPVTGHENPHFLGELSRLRSDMTRDAESAGRLRIVYLTRVNRLYMPTLGELEETFRFKVDARLDDGMVLSGGSR